MQQDIYNQASDLARQRRPFAFATVVRVAGSSSARRGAKAIIDLSGKLLAGWVGGGCAESAVRSEALKAIESGLPRILTIDMTDEQLGVGMPCGGTMDIFIEPVLPPPELLILGHGRIAETLAAIGNLMGFAVIVNDPAAERASFPEPARLVTDDFDLTETPITSNSYVVVATQHKGDHLWLQRALEGDAPYVAMIASQHRSALVFDYLRAAGVPEASIATVRAPAGLHLGAATPEEIALSVISEIVAVRRGGSVTRLDAQPHMNAPGDSLPDAVIRQCEAEHSL